MLPLSLHIYYIQNTDYVCSPSEHAVLCYKIKFGSLLHQYKTLLENHIVIALSKVLMSHRVLVFIHLQAADVIGRR